MTRANPQRKTGRAPQKKPGKDAPRRAEFSPEPGVSIHPEGDVAWYIVPGELPRAVEGQWARATGGRGLPFDGNFLREFRDSAAEVCKGRWSLTEAISGPEPVVVWVALMHPGLSKEQRESAWLDLQVWSGIRVESSLSGEGWVAIDGDPYGTLDLGMAAHQLRFYPEHGVVLHVVGEDETEVERVLAGIRVTGRAPAEGEAPRRGAPTFESLLAPETARGVADCPGPACRDLQRLASSLKNPDISFEAEMVDGGSMHLSLIGGEKEPYWMPSFDCNPPGGDYLSGCLDFMRDGLAGREVKRVLKVKLRRPRGDEEIEKIAAERFAEALREIAVSSPPRAKKQPRPRR